MTQKIVSFPILGGGDGLISDMGNDLWVLKIGGALLTLGPREGWRLCVDPFPHAWRVSFQLNENDSRVLWFDVLEADAMSIEKLAGD